MTKQVSFSLGLGLVEFNYKGLQETLGNNGNILYLDCCSDVYICQNSLNYTLKWANL